MAYCINCGLKLPEEALYCPKCGKEVKKNSSVREKEETKIPVEKKEKPRKVSNNKKEDLVKILPDLKLQSEGESILLNVEDYVPAKDILIQRENRMDVLIPNTKEGLLESMAATIKSVDVTVFGKLWGVPLGKRNLMNALDYKVNQIYKQAENLFFGEEEFLRINALYDKYAKRKVHEKRKRTVKMISLIIAVIFVFLVFPLFIIGLR